MMCITLPNEPVVLGWNCGGSEADVGLGYPWMTSCLSWKALSLTQAATKPIASAHISYLHSNLK